MKIDASNVIVETIDDRVYGLNIAIWDELVFRRGITDQNYLQTVKDAKICHLDFPGGAGVMAFDDHSRYLAS